MNYSDFPQTITVEENNIVYSKYFFSEKHFSYFQPYTNIKHREGDLPATIQEDGSQFWWFHGKRHRELGPAIIYADGRRQWWYHGYHVPVISQTQFEQWLKLRLFQ